MGDTRRFARVGEKNKSVVIGVAPMRERERERERVANYLELPNNLMTFLQKSHPFFEP